MPNRNRSDTIKLSGVLDSRAKCEDCEWEAFTRNALGLGKLHHNQTGHSVEIESVLSVSYCLESSKHYQNWKEVHDQVNKVNTQ